MGVSPVRSSRVPGIEAGRPVFWLSFTLDDYLSRHVPGTGPVVVTSASSKAALWLAQVVTAGLTHPDAAGTPGGRAGVGFFVPDEIRARAREWGWPDLEQRFGAVLGGFADGSVPLYAIQLALALGAPAVRYLDEDPASLALAEALGAQVSDGPLPRKLGSYAVTVDASLNVRGLGCALRSTGRTASAPASESTCRTLPSRCSTCT